MVLASVFFCSCGHYSYRSILLRNDKIQQDSIESTIDNALKAWQSAPWHKEYSGCHFRQYILPPQISDETVEYYWRTDIPQWKGFSTSGKDLASAAKEINSRIQVDTRPQDWGNPAMGYTMTKSGKSGKCDDRSILTAMAMRSMGIPAAFEMIPMWGSSNNGHSFCSVITPSDSVLVFQNGGNDGTESEFVQKVPKIYRRMFIPEKGCLTELAGKGVPVPPVFQDGRLKDVTDRHCIGHQDVHVPIGNGIRDKAVYLSVFTPDGWYPVTYTANKGSRTVFHHVGNGTDKHGAASLKGEDIGNGILYLPTTYNGDTEAAGWPIIVSADSIRTLRPSNSTETVRLTRKYPRSERIIRYADYMVGGIIEGANRKDFSDAVCLYMAMETPHSRMQTVSPWENGNFRYLRFRKPSGTFSIAELHAAGIDGQPIASVPLVPDYLSCENTDNVFDGKPLTYYEVPKSMNFWIGCDFGKPVRIAEIAFCPRNDDNEVSPGDRYELLYWDNGWKSLGTKTATGYWIEYENVPKGALLWLRDRTKGKEERPFTYENGKQIWW